MAFTIVEDLQKHYVDINRIDYSTEDISTIGPLSELNELEEHFIKIEQTSYSTEKIKYVGYFLPELEAVLPFRVAFKTLGIPGYSPLNPAPIGIAVIGVNNYIL